MTAPTGERRPPTLSEWASQFGPIEVLDEQKGEPCALCGHPMDGWVCMTSKGYAHPMFLCPREALPAPWADAVKIMAEATSYFVQDPYASEALDALVAAGWTIEPPPHEGEA